MRMGRLNHAVFSLALLTLVGPALASPDSGNAACPNGCIGVYAAVPEPSTLTLLLGGLATLSGVLRLRRRARRQNSTASSGEGEPLGSR